MKCCFRRSRRILKKYPKNKVLPFDPQVPLRDYRDKLDKEIITCFHCKDKFHLHDLQIHCNGCLQFFHCHIAGRCIGNECKGTLKYCKDCISQQFTKTQCLCTSCHS